MRKSILVLLGLLIMTMFLMGCAEESVESDDDEGNLAGEAFRAGKGCIPAECVYQDYADGIKDCGHKDDGCGGTINCNYQAYAGGLECPSDYECLYQAYAGGVKGQCVEEQCIPAECVYQDYAGGIKDCGHKDDGCGGTINCNYQAYAGGLECPSDYECLYQAYAGGVKGQCK